VVFRKMLNQLKKMNESKCSHAYINTYKTKQGSGERELKCVKCHMLKYYPCQNSNDYVDVLIHRDEVNEDEHD
jgi:hypothetical protein